MSIENEIEALRDPDWVVRTRAARALVFRHSGEDGPRRAPVLLSRSQATAPFPTVATILEEFLQSVRPPVTEAPASACPPGDARAISPLLAAADDPTKNVRTAVGRALAVIGRTTHDQWGRDALKAAVEDERWRVRFAAARAYSWLDSEPCDPLVPLLGDGHESLRWAAVVTIVGRKNGRHGHFGNLINAFRASPAPEPQLAKAVLPALSDPAATVRRAAVRGLGPADGDASLEGLLTALREDSDPAVRRLAASALVDRRAIPVLLGAIQDPDQGVRACSARTLVKLGERPPIEPLLVGLRARNRDLRCGTAWLLGELGDSRAVEPLVALHERSTSRGVRQAVARALAALGAQRDTRAE